MSRFYICEIVKKDVNVQIIKLINSQKTEKPRNFTDKIINNSYRIGILRFCWKIFPNISSMKLSAEFEKRKHEFEFTKNNQSYLFINKKL